MSRVVDASAARVFRFLADPANHVAFDTSGMVRGAAPGAAISGLGDVFVMNMYNDIKGDHQVENHVVVYEADRAVGWAPAGAGETPAGHTWTWRLLPCGDDRTLVSLVYDWSRFTHLDMIEHLPVVDCAQMRVSLDRLARAVGGGGS